MTRSKPPAAPLLVVLLVLLAGCSAAPVERGRKTATGFDWADRTDVERTPRPSPTRSGFDRERVWPGLDDWEPSVAADRFAPFVYQATTRYGTRATCGACPDPAIAFRVSSDGGATFPYERILPHSSGIVGQYDPELAVSDDGTVFAAWMHGYTPGVVFAKSTDHGETWTDPKAVMGGLPYSDKPAIAVSPDGRDVHVGFNSAHAYIATSTDGGASFAAPARTDRENSRYWFHYQGAAIGESVWFATADYSDDYRGEIRASVVTSTDRGTTWTTTLLGRSAEAPPCGWAAGCYFGFLGTAVGLAAGPDGSVLFAWSAGATKNAEPKLYARVSRDGTNWGDPVEIGWPGGSVIHGFPAVAAGLVPGDFRVVWADDSLAPKAAFNVWARKTRDFGASWSDPVRLSDRGDGAPYKSSTGFGFPYGDYLFAAVGKGGVTHAIWGEGTSYNGPGGAWSTRESPVARESSPSPD